MPTVKVNILEGYSDELKVHLSSSLVSTVAAILDTEPNDIAVCFQEAACDVHQQCHKNQRISVPSKLRPEQLVLNYLKFMEKRLLSQAQQYLTDEFKMTFPGNNTFTELQDLVDWSKDHYRFVKKSIHATQVSYNANQITVTCQGLLSGEWVDGQSFTDVRFIDLFTIKNGKLHRQEVWNDLALWKPK